MIYYEYISPDNRVLFNIQQMNFGNRIVSSHEYDLYLIERELAEAIIEYHYAENKDLITPFQNSRYPQINYENIEECLQQNYSNSLNEIIIVEHTIDKN